MLTLQNTKSKNLLTYFFFHIDNNCMNILQEFFREGLTITRLVARRLSLRCRAAGERARAGAAGERARAGAGAERAGLRPRLRAWAGAGRAAWAGGAGGGGCGDASS